MITQGVTPVANGTIKKHINPPDLDNTTIDKTLSNNVTKAFTSVGAWYSAIASNNSTSGNNLAEIMNEAETFRYAYTVNSGNTSWSRSMTPWVFIPEGVVFHVRLMFTNASDSGLMSAPEL